MDTNLLNDWLCFALRAQHIPLHIGAQLFAGNACGSLNQWAVLSGKFPVSVEPRPHVAAVGVSQQFSQCGLPSENIGSTAQGLFFRLGFVFHGVESTSRRPHLSTLRRPPLVGWPMLM